MASTSKEKCVLDRRNDDIYQFTTKLVKAIINLSQIVEKSHPNSYVQLVHNVGLVLRDLLVSVDKLTDMFEQQELK